MAGRLSLTAIGRAVAGRVRPKHAIKRVDRLLANPHLRCERWTLWSALAASLLEDFRRPVILVDWTKTAEGFHALVAAVPLAGRALPIYEEVHPESRLGNRRVQGAFLRALRDVLPRDAKPIVVSDAGFYGAFFREILRLGWDFVGRVRGHAKVRFPSGGRPVTKAYLYGQATLVPSDLGPCELYSTAKRLTARMVLVRGKRKPGCRPENITATEAAKRDHARDPWLLATSLTDGSAAAIVATYALRMKIEETFRDAKNHRFGWSLRHVRSRSADRLAMLLLLASLAMVAVTLVGFEAERRRLHRAYQANTLSRRVLSLVVLGGAVLRRSDHRAWCTVDRIPRIAAHFRLALRELALPAHA
ncbi:MAG: IS4-like element ISSod3 family transposase [Vulcanimicrobiaceae bacterium]